MSDARLRLVSSALALVSIGLLLSLLPRTNFVSRAAGDIVDAVGPVWPEQSVEQVLVEGLDIVAEVRIWAAAGFGRGETPIVAALLRGPDREIVRQVAVKIQPSKLLQPYVVEFPAYLPVPSEPLILQLWVSTERKNHAIFGTTAPGGEAGGATINLNPTDQGPLAYELLWRGDGWRAALEGSWLDRLRLAGGIAAAVAAVLLRPGVGRRLGTALGRARAAMLTVGRPIAGKLRLARRWLAAQGSRGNPASRRRVIYVYPWLISAFAILHYLATNLFQHRAYEAIIPSLVIMAGVTVVFIVLLFILKSAASAALFTGCLGLVFFSYGHIYTVNWQQPERALLLGIGGPLMVGVGMLLRGRDEFAHKIGRILNHGSVVLIIFPIYQLGYAVVTTSIQQNRDTLADFVDIEKSISETRRSISSDELRDIYFIILDAYPRSGSPADFDNSAFVQELENRGFYVDPQARSNYTCSDWSISSTLNMNYIDEDATCSEPLAKRYLIYDASIDHALGRILTEIGYSYIHVASGYHGTNVSRNADVIVDFTPSGRIVSEYSIQDPRTQYHYSFANAFRVTNRFMAGFLDTTLFKTYGGVDAFGDSHSDPYGWSSPHRNLAWLEFMRESSTLDGPKFVFAHLVSPHSPYFFDQHGKMSLGGWGDSHDPEVGGAFVGQILWLNQELLSVIDSILAVDTLEPLIVIIGDHGHEDNRKFTLGHEILAAYFLPGGGEGILYRGVTSVNVGRVILNYYFELGLKILEDRIYINRG